MRYYPLFADLRGKICLVVGGGAVAERKTKSLLKCQALVTVISPTLSAGLARLKDKNKIVWRSRGYTADSLRGVFLVVAATDNRAINSQVSSSCRRKGVLVNVVDVPEESNFIAPSFIEKKGLVIAISTGGRAPCLAKKIRQDLERDFIPRYGKLLDELTPLREKMKLSCSGFKKRKSALKKLIDSRL